MREHHFNSGQVARKLNPRASEKMVTFKGFFFRTCWWGPERDSVPPSSVSGCSPFPVTKTDREMNDNCIHSPKDAGSHAQRTRTLETRFRLLRAEYLALSGTLSPTFSSPAFRYKISSLIKQGEMQENFLRSGKRRADEDHKWRRIQTLSSYTEM